MFLEAVVLVVTVLSMDVLYALILPPAKAVRPAPTKVQARAFSVAAPSLGAYLVLTLPLVQLVVVATM